MTLYHVYIDTLDTSLITPDYNDALRCFRKMVREYPDEVVDFDSVETNDSMRDVADGIYEGKRIRIMQCVPE